MEYITSHGYDLPVKQVRWLVMCATTCGGHSFGPIQNRLSDVVVIG